MLLSSHLWGDPGGGATERVSRVSLVLNNTFPHNRNVDNFCPFRWKTTQTSNRFQLAELLLLPLPLSLSLLLLLLLLLVVPAETQECDALVQFEPFPFERPNSPEHVDMLRNVRASGRNGRSTSSYLCQGVCCGFFFFKEQRRPCRTRAEKLALMRRRSE